MDVLKLLGGVALLLYGMKVMGSSLEKLAGRRLKSILGKMTSNIWKGFGFGLLVTAAIQSSAATIVMVVGFVNSGLMSLVQATGVIMGANIGTSVTGWIISLSGLKGSDSIYYAILFIGVVMFWFVKTQKGKNIGLILIGFSILMIGTQFMSASVAGLKQSPVLGNFVTFLSNPILGCLFGMVFTVVIQSSSASVGVLQSFASGYALPFAFCVPFILGANIGTCSTVIFSSIGATKEAKRTAAVDVLYNVISTIIILPIFYLVGKLANISILSESATAVGIAISNTGIKVAQLLIMFPLSALLCKLANKIVKDVPDENDKTSMLDERLLSTPSVAIDQATIVIQAMADLSIRSLKESTSTIEAYDGDIVEKVIKDEGLIDNYEDKLGTFLVKLSEKDLLENESRSVTMLLHLIGDFERISDHAKNIVESTSELAEKKIEFTSMAQNELKVILGAINEILDISQKTFISGDMSTALLVEPLEEVIDDLKDEIKKNHIERLRKGECTIELGFILSDILTDLERVSDHCSNIALCIIDNAQHEIDKHEYIREFKESNKFDEMYEEYKSKYHI